MRGSKVIHYEIEASDPGDVWYLYEKGESQNPWPVAMVYDQDDADLIAKLLNEHVGYKPEEQQERMMS